MTDVQALAREALEDAKRATAAPWWSIVNENTHLYVNSTDAIVAMVYRRPPRCGGTVLMPFGENTRWICNARTREPLLAQSVLSLAARVGDLEEALREVTGAAKVQSCPFCDDKGRIEVFPPAALDEAWPVGSPVRYFKPCRACFGQLHIAKAILEHARAALAAPRETTKEVKDAS